MKNKINISMFSNEKFVVLKMQYCDHMVNLRQQVKHKKINFPIKLFVRGFFKLYKKRYLKYSENLVHRLASSYINVWF